MTLVAASSGTKMRSKPANRCGKRGHVVTTLAAVQSLGKMGEVTAYEDDAKNFRGSGKGKSSQGKSSQTLQPDGSADGGEKVEDLAPPRSGGDPKKTSMGEASSFLSAVQPGWQNYPAPAGTYIIASTSSTPPPGWESAVVVAAEKMENTVCKISKTTQQKKKNPEDRGRRGAPQELYYKLSCKVQTAAFGVLNDPYGTWLQTCCNFGVTAERNYFCYDKTPLPPDCQ
ncbi:unnamed protein product [Amoebophrya sp. A120]|nr:unnamed protein product [Amoebophrya sp. A120]|eukprot:GSA120T00000881001.1